MTLRVQGLGKRYGDSWALRDCSFELERGRVTALVGANGAGKTTLLTMLAGVLRPDEGTVEARGRISFVAQDKPLYGHLDAGGMFQIARRLNDVWHQQRAESWARRFDVPLDRRCRRLSTGQQTQVALAVALGSRPDVLLLDEPLASLDPVVRRDVMRELLTEAADTGMALLMSTHVVAEISGVADSLVLLRGGKLVLSGDLDELMSSHSRYVGPPARTPPAGEVVHASHHEQQSAFLVRGGDRPGEPWVTEPVTVEDLVLAHLTGGGAA
ncbi:ABC transporter ATP-binding protein [Kibdelosporangium persicum]|uniref:ABC transporter ATP-binding protein YtrB n=1 Tax=Kibdelosporangium persicum TaxID=2698649 RepID=A0ABX2F542_9PSEU|nr:ABC transporter ATP-binding protein [Kibdelosporangium persicum]NRN65925.1 ABC transporter ATP-binding protein YtrB [Kibdelosporangium persicum]